MTLYNAQSLHLQFAPVLTEDVVRRIGVRNFFLYKDRGVAALWDQRAFKQIVARRYRRPLRGFRPLYNLYASLFRRIPLPREGGALDQTSIAFLSLDDESSSNGSALLRDLLSHCGTRAASIGVHPRHPLVPAITAMKPIKYPARVYAVSFDGLVPPNGRPVQPEAALL